jgi:oligopeptide transport system substrate-binding protein
VTLSLRKKLSSKYAGIILGIFAILLLSACGDSAPPNVVVAESQSLLNRGNGAEPESLDMHKSATAEAHDVQRDLGEGLIGYTRDGKQRAAAAERWEASDDGLEYTFWLRPNARWSNGEPVTADDFVYSYQRLVDPATAAIFIDSIAAVENAEEILASDLSPDQLGVVAINPYKLQIRLQRPVPYFLSLLTHPSTFPVHRGSIEQHGDAYSHPGNLVSSGAYKLHAWEVGSYIELVRNEHYWDNTHTAIDRVRFYVIPQPMTELNRYRAGELDITQSIPTAAFAQMLKERPDEVRTSPSLGVYYYGFNLSNPKFSRNSKLRQALSLAIDREAIATNVVGRGESPAYSWVPEGVAGYQPRRLSYTSMTQVERNEKARQLYRAAGFGPNKPFKLEVRYNTSNAQQRIALAVQSMWLEALGVEVTLVNEDLRVMLANIGQKVGVDVFRLSWSGDYNDAHAFLSILESGNPSNLVGYQNPHYDSLMDRAAEQIDFKRREIILGEAESVMLADHPVIPIYFHVNKSMVSQRVEGWGDNVLNYHYSQQLSLSGQ